MKFRILDEARAEANEAAAWYESQMPGLGEEFLDALAKATKTMLADPERFARLETSASEKNLRRYLLPRFPYVVVYELKDGEGVIVAIAHATRRPGYWNDRLR